MADACEEFDFREFGASSVSATESMWMRNLHECNDVFPGEIIGALNTCKRVGQVSQGQWPAFGVFKPGADEALAVVDVFLSEHGKRHLKMMSCTLEPSLQQGVYDADAQKTDLALGVFGAAIESAYRLKNLHKSSALRIYGRTNLFMDFLKKLAKLLHEKGFSEASVDIEGRWLVINE